MEWRKSHLKHEPLGLVCTSRRTPHNHPAYWECQMMVQTYLSLSCEKLNDLHVGRILAAMYNWHLSVVARKFQIHTKGILPRWTWRAKGGVGNSNRSKMTANNSNQKKKKSEKIRQQIKNIKQNTNQSRIRLEEQDRYRSRGSTPDARAQSAEWHVPGKVESVKKSQTKVNYLGDSRNYNMIESKNMKVKRIINDFERCIAKCARGNSSSSQIWSCPDNWGQWSI